MSFLTELKRRKIIQVAIAYAVVAWLLVQIAVSVEDPLNLPDWVDTLVIVLVFVGFPLALVVSWAKARTFFRTSTMHSRSIQTSLWLTR